jgi:S-adenosylmethionine synthetase
MGEITAANLPHPQAYQEMVCQTIASIGYDGDTCGFNPHHCTVMMNISQQSPNIAAGTSEEMKGAGDQGMMFGYATNETSEYMPLPITLAHQLTHRLAEVRKNGEMGYLLPDGKAQVTVEYRDGRPVHVRRVVIAAHHREGYEKQIKSSIVAKVVQPVIPSEYLNSDFDWEGHVEVNGTGAFTIGGPLADAGLTGRKIIVDTYGGIGRHGCSPLPSRKIWFC